MDKILQMTMLFDFYSELLTEKQKRAFELFHMEDYSLAEIAELLGISRQGVREVICQAEKKLEHFEGKLRLLEKHTAEAEQWQQVLPLLDKIVSKKSIGCCCHDLEPDSDIQKIYEIVRRIVDGI